MLSLFYPIHFYTGKSSDRVERSCSRSPRKKPSKWKDLKKDHKTDKGGEKEKGDKPQRPRDYKTRPRGGKSEEKKLEYPFLSPQTFEEAWFGSFINPSIRLFFTTLGFVVSRIPVLNKTPGKLSLIIIDKVIRLKWWRNVEGS